MTTGVVSDWLPVRKMLAGVMPAKGRFCLLAGADFFRGFPEARIYLPEKVVYD